MLRGGRLAAQQLLDDDSGEFGGIFGGQFGGQDYFEYKFSQLLDDGALDLLNRLTVLGIFAAGLSSGLAAELQLVHLVDDLEGLLKAVRFLPFL